MLWDSGVGFPLTALLRDVRERRVMRSSELIWISKDMFTPQMRSEYSLVHFAELEFQWYNEVYMLFKCDLHNFLSM